MRQLITTVAIIILTFITVHYAFVFVDSYFDRVAQKEIELIKQRNTSDSLRYELREANLKLGRLMMALIHKDNKPMYDSLIVEIGKDN